MISINNVSFAYPGSSHLVLDGFSATFSSNCICGLLGKNGTGKSTLLYLMMGLLRPKSGTVVVDGMDAGRRLPEMLSEMFIVPEEFDLPDITLNSYLRLCEPFYPHFDRQILLRSLEEFELDDKLRLGRLSMGQKKKVYMSVALASGTKMLFMDEPTNGLDIPSKSQFRRAVSRCMNEERTLVISTHQVHDVEALLDHVLIVNDKRVAFDESVSDITNRLRFDMRTPSDPTDGVIYSAPTLQGNATVAYRREGEGETPINLELLFNAVISGKLNS